MVAQNLNTTNNKNGTTNKKTTHTSKDESAKTAALTIESDKKQMTPPSEEPVLLDFDGRRFCGIYAFIFKEVILMYASSLR